MTESYSHKITIEIGLNMSEYMSPENIVGIKAYLGVENDLDVLSAVANDKFRKIESAVKSAGFEIINAGVTQVQSNIVDDPKNIPNGKNSKEIVAPNAEHKETEKIVDGNTPEEDAVLGKIKSAQKKIGDGLITKLTISKDDYKKGINSIEMLKKVSGLFDDTEVEFDNFDVEEHKLLVEFMDSMGSTHNIWID